VSVKADGNKESVQLFPFYLALRAKTVINEDTISLFNPFYFSFLTHHKTMISPSKIIPSSTTNTISSSNELHRITEDVESSSSSDSEDNTGTDSKDKTKTHSTDLKLRKMSTNRVQRDQSIVSIRSLSITPSNTPRSSITGRHRKRRSSVATIMRSIGKLKRKSTKEDANSTSTDPNALNRQNSISEAELHQAITEEHEALIESYGIRSLRTSAFFVGKFNLFLDPETQLLLTCANFPFSYL